MIKIIFISILILLILCGLFYTTAFYFKFKGWYDEYYVEDK